MNMYKLRKRYLTIYDHETTPLFKGKLENNLKHKKREHVNASININDNMIVKGIYVSSMIRL